MSTDFILRQEFAQPEYAALSDVQRLEKLQLENIPTKQSIAVSDIRAYLNLKDKLIDFENATSFAAKKAARTFQIHPIIHMANPAIEAKFKSVIAALVADTSILIDATDESYILSLGNKMISRAQQLEITEVSLWDVKQARI